MSEFTFFPETRLSLDFAMHLCTASVGGRPIEGGDMCLGLWRYLCALC
jgi:hypothetical protein